MNNFYHYAFFCSLKKITYIQDSRDIVRIQIQKRGYEIYSNAVAYSFYVNISLDEARIKVYVSAMLPGLYTFY